jgi:hypothetical protein
MAIADGGELIVLAPGVAKFGEDAKCDELIRACVRVPPERNAGDTCMARGAERLPMASARARAARHGRCERCACVLVQASTATARRPKCCSS